MLKSEPLIDAHHDGNRVLLRSPQMHNSRGSRQCQTPLRRSRKEPQKMGPFMMKKFLKQSLSGFLFYSGIFRSTKFLSARILKKALVLCYHRVIAGPPDSYSTPGTQLDLANFRSHLAFLLRNYKIIRLSELIQELVERKELSDENYAVLTFDDGFIDGYTNIFPLLKEFAIPATFFVSPWAISSGSLYWQDELWYCLNSVNGPLTHLHFGDFDLPIVSQTDKLNARAQMVKILSLRNSWQRDELLSEIKVSLGMANQDVSSRPRMLTRENTAEMAASGLVEWGAHSLTHPMLPFCTEDQLEIEVKESKNDLESMFGSPVDYFAYPFGKHTQRAADAVQRFGYKAAVTTNDGFVAPGDDLFLLNRLNVFRDDTFVSLAAQKIMRFNFRNILGCKSKEHE